MNNARLRQQATEQQPFRVVQRPNHYGEEYPVYNHDWFSIGISIGIVVAIITWVLIW
jgi:hypothetical protein